MDGWGWGMGGGHGAQGMGMAAWLPNHIHTNANTARLNQLHVPTVCVCVHARNLAYTEGVGGTSYTLPSSLPRVELRMRSGYSKQSTSATAFGRSRPHARPAAI